MASLFGGRGLDLDLVLVQHLEPTDMFVELLPIYPWLWQETYVSLISGDNEFHSHDITMESSSYQASNIESFGLGPVSKRWLNMPFPCLFLIEMFKPLKTLQVILSCQLVCCLNIP